MAESPQEEKWYFKINLLVMAILVVGPFALPLLWYNPKIKKTPKIIWSSIILAVSVVSIVITGKAVHSIVDYYQLIGDINK